MSKTPKVTLITVDAENGMDKLFPPPWADPEDYQHWIELRKMIEEEHAKFVVPPKGERDINKMKLEATRHLFIAIMNSMPTGDAQLVGQTAAMFLATVNTILNIKKGREPDEDDGPSENSWTGRKR
jgi:hypothetical protein